MSIKKQSHITVTIDPDSYEAVSNCLELARRAIAIWKERPAGGYPGLSEFNADQVREMQRALDEFWG